MRATYRRSGFESSFGRLDGPLSWSFVAMFAVVVVAANCFL